MEPKTPLSENEVRRRWAGDKIERERGAAAWCRRFTERLRQYPSRPDLENAIQVFQRTAGDFDSSAAALEATFGPAPERPQPLEQRNVVRYSATPRPKRQARKAVRPRPQATITDDVVRLMDAHQQASAARARLLEVAREAVRTAGATWQEAAQVLEHSRLLCQQAQRLCGRSRDGGE